MTFMQDDNPDEFMQSVHWRYEAVSEIQCGDGIVDTYQTHALIAYERTCAGWIALEIVHDVTTNPILCAELAEQFTRLQLSPIHLREVLEDTLAQR